MLAITETLQPNITMPLRTSAYPKMLLLNYKEGLKTL